MAPHQANPAPLGIYVKNLYAARRTSAGPSCASRDEARVVVVFDGPGRREAAPVGLVNYAGVGGVYATLSKEQKSPPIGLEGLSRIADALRRRAPQLPIVGIAGIDAGNAGPVIGAGADGVAVISALSLAADPTAAARALRAIVDGMLARRGT
jgi:thiamine-phosphate pyrophosphorylase